VAIPRGPDLRIDPKDDQKVLRDAGVATDAEGLLAFFRSRTPSPSDPIRLTARIQELGSPVFLERERASRELTDAGRTAMPLLRSALNSPDPEVVRRAARCVEQIENAPTTTLLVAAARLTAAARPAGAAGALVGIFPVLEDDWAEDTVLQSLAVVALNNGVADPATAAAAADKDPLKRAAAGFVLGQASGEQRQTAVRLMADADSRVRLRAAGGLVLGGERAAVPTLIALLDEAPTTVAWRAEELLDQIAGELDLPGAAGTDVAGRAG
jgi:HEAT repeat protein